MRPGASAGDRAPQNLTQAQQTAANTKQILATDQAILSNVQKTLQAVTGNRSSLAQGSLAQMALGGGFSMGRRRLWVR